MIKHAPIFETRLATTPALIEEAHALRYSVFVGELGAGGPLVDHARKLERDRFDAHADHLLLLDRARPEGTQVVGVYRVMDRDGARSAGQFYSENEYDLSVLRASDRPLLELGRSCLHRDYRGGGAMLHLWRGLAEIVRRKRAEVLFGVASFHGVDLTALAQPLAVLARDHAAPADLMVRSIAYQRMDLATEFDRVSAMKQVPALIKAYLRLGGFVGDGAFVDHAFNTTDVCLVLDVARMTPRSRAIYAASTFSGTPV